MGECQDLCSGDTALTGVWRMYWKEQETREGDGQEAFAGSWWESVTWCLVVAETDGEADRLEA